VTELAAKGRSWVQYTALKILTQPQVLMAVGIHNVVLWVMVHLRLVGR